MGYNTKIKRLHEIKNDEKNKTKLISLVLLSKAKSFSHSEKKHFKSHKNDITISTLKKHSSLLFQSYRTSSPSLRKQNSLKKSNICNILIQLVKLLVCILALSIIMVYCELNYDLLMADCEDCFKTTDEFIEEAGFTAEVHEIITSDGYVLQIFRIPSQNPPLILQAGFSSSSDAFVDNGQHSPAFYFARKGYDVWITNVRGSKYGNNHIQISNQEKQFHDYTWEEHGLLDSKAAIDYILQNTGFDQVAYLGHSCGTVQMLTAMALEPEYFTQKIKAFILYGPISSLVNCESLLAHIPFKSFFIDLMEIVGMSEFPPKSDNIKKMIWKMASIKPLARLLVGMISEKVDSQFNEKSVPLAFVHANSGSSIKFLRNMLQNIKYGFSKHQPEKGGEIQYFDLSNIQNVKIGIFAGGKDKLASVQDARWLNEQLNENSVVEFYKEYENMGHTSFLIPHQSQLQYLDDTFEFLQKHYL
jgi:lysosomal acid lipase/cholesteryl ester hydrolase